MTATTTEVRMRGLAAIFATAGCEEVLVTEPGRGWMASVLPGDTPQDEVDVLVFATDPALQWSDEYLEWADSLESLLTARPVAA
ncbi:hypothetical protein [Rhodococcus sp. NPDC059234]|uniref:hypothetical protein n=1 Tax=Rhodococcus sp. NPDC059234 TaxID=3346781 RepID=UPI0036728FA4